MTKIHKIRCDESKIQSDCGLKKKKEKRKKKQIEEENRGKEKPGKLEVRTLPYRICLIPTDNYRLYKNTILRYTVMFHRL